MSLLPKRQIDRTVGLTLRDEVNRIFEDFLTDGALGIPPGEWMPALDISETDTQVMVKAEVPGIDARDIDVSIAGDTLTIKGEKKEETSKKEQNFTQMERRYGFFQRSVTLPSAVEQSKISASYKSGVLSITMDKKEPSESRNIQVKVE
jgi:HSP20 family protein